MANGITQYIRSYNLTLASTGKQLSDAGVLVSLFNIKRQYSKTGEVNFFAKTQWVAAGIVMIGGVLYAVGMLDAADEKREHELDALSSDLGLNIVPESETA